MKQKYHNYKLWEEYRDGMWRKVTKSEEIVYLKKAVDFTGNHILYGYWMMRVIAEWPISAEQNLTNPDINHKAWIGQAACCLAFNCPEYIVRMAWHQLSIKQQRLANEQARLAYRHWVENYSRNFQLSIFEWDNEKKTWN